MKSANTRRSEWLVAILILISTAAALRPLLGAGEFKHKQHAAARYLASGQYKQARILAEELIHKGPDSDFNLAIMAEALAGESKPDQANLYYNQISHTDSRLYILATYGTAIDAFGDGRVRDAERLLKQTLKLNPRHTDASRKLAYLMRIEGRIWESEAPVRELIRQGHIRNDHLSMLGSRAVILDERLFIEKCITAVPDDPLPRLGKATLHLLKNRYGKAESLLTEIIRSAPEILSAQAKFGGLLNDQQRDDEFISWHQALPVDADQHPEIWYVRGCFLSRLRRNDEAARCFIETLTRSPNHVEATYMLSQSLQASGKSELALLTAKRSERFHADRIASRHRYHCDSGGTATACRTAGERGRPPVAMQKQSQADWYCTAQLPRRFLDSSKRHCSQRGRGVGDILVATHPSLHGSGWPL